MYMFYIVANLFKKEINVAVEWLFGQVEEFKLPAKVLTDEETLVETNFIDTPIIQ